MRVTIILCLCLAALTSYAPPARCFAQATGSRIASRDPIENPTAQKLTLIFFWKEDNAASQQMMADLKQAVAKRSDRASWTSVNVTEPANQPVVEQYKVSRAPMPMVLCVAPNGAVTGGIPGKVTDDEVERVLVTPTMTQCMKALQDGKLVLVHVRPDDRASWPTGASQFAADPEFKTRTTTVSFRRDDPNEKRFLADMEIHPATTNASVVSLLAPPGVLVAKFSATATKDEIAEKLHAAGKCCNDPNCIHNKKGS